MLKAFFLVQGGISIAALLLLLHFWYLRRSLNTFSLLYLHGIVICTIPNVAYVGRRCALAPMFCVLETKDMKLERQDFDADMQLKIQG